MSDTEIDPCFRKMLGQLGRATLPGDVEDYAASGCSLVRRLLISFSSLLRRNEWGHSSGEAVAQGAIAQGAIAQGAVAQSEGCPELGRVDRCN